jgi:hypothetical protein
MSFRVDVMREDDVRNARLYWQMKCSKEREKDIIHFDRRWRIILKSLPGIENSPTAILVVMIQQVQLFNGKAPRTFEMFTNDSHEAFCGQFVEAFPDTHILFTMPNAKVNFEQLQRLPFKREQNCGFVVGDFYDIEREDGCLISMPAQIYIARYIDWLGIRKAVDIERYKRLLKREPWRFLRTMNIEGNVTDSDLVWLCLRVPCLFSVKVSSVQVLQLVRFRGFTELISLTISGPVQVGCSDEEWKRRPEWLLKELELTNCSEIKSFQFLKRLKLVTVLHLFFTEALHASDELGSLFAGCYINLGVLNLSYTSAVTDDLLRALKVANVVLGVLRVNCGPSSAGFTDEALKTYLEWPKNTNLAAVELYGHNQLTEAIFNCKPACADRLEQLDVRETKCFGQEHHEVLKQVYKFGMESSICSRKMTKARAMQPVLYVYFTYQPKVIEYTQGFPITTLDIDDNRRRITVQYWEKVGDTSIPKASNVAHISPSISYPALSTQEREAMEKGVGENLKTSVMTFAIPEAVLRREQSRWFKTSEALDYSSIGASPTFLDSSLIPVQGQPPQTSAPTLDTQLSNTDSDTAQSASMPVSALAGSSSGDATSSGPQKSCLSVGIRSEPINVVTDPPGASSISLAVDLTRKSLTLTSVIRPFEFSSDCIIRETSEDDFDDSIEQFAGVASAAAPTRPSPPDGSSSIFLGPKELSASRISLYTFARTSTESISSDLWCSTDDPFVTPSSELIDDWSWAKSNYSTTEQENADTSYIGTPTRDELSYDEPMSNHPENLTHAIDWNAVDLSGDLTDSHKPSEGLQLQDDMESGISGGGSHIEAAAMDDFSADIPMPESGDGGAMSSRSILLQQSGQVKPPGTEGLSLSLVSDYNIDLPSSFIESAAEQGPMIPVSPPPKIARMEDTFFRVDSCPARIFDLEPSVSREDHTESTEDSVEPAPVDKYYPEDMFSAPGTLTDVTTDGRNIAPVVPTEDPAGVKWKMMYAIALHPVQNVRC